MDINFSDHELAIERIKEAFEPVFIAVAIGILFISFIAAGATILSNM